MVALDPNRFSRVVVLGCSGSGKTTLGAKLATKLGLPFVATDDIYWRSDWTPVPAPEVRAWLDEATARPHWVLDGNFDDQRDILWARAELAVWLDLPWATTVWRVLRRNCRWWIEGAPIWGGVRMTLPRLVSGVRHAARGHAVKRRGYPDMLMAFPNLTVIRIRSVNDLEVWSASGFPVPG